MGTPVPGTQEQAEALGPLGTHSRLMWVCGVGTPTAGGCVGLSALWEGESMQMLGWERDRECQDNAERFKLKEGDCDRILGRNSSL